MKSIWHYDNEKEGYIFSASFELNSDLGEEKFMLGFLKFRNDEKSYVWYDVMGTDVIINATNIAKAKIKVELYLHSRYSLISSAIRVHMLLEYSSMKGL